MTKAAKITVAGAGALGLSCALALADAGHAVTVCDPADPLANASGVAAGMLAPVFEAVLDAQAGPHFDLLLAARDLWPELEARAGLYVDRTGAMAVGGEAWLERISAAAGRLGLHLAEIPGHTARGLAPGLSDAFPLALLTREDWRLDAAAALAGLRRAAEVAGATFRREAVSGPADADWLVVATGAGPGLIDAAPELAHLAPIKGHILRVQAPGLGGAAVRGEGAYAVPVGDGLAFGATMEAGVGDPAVDPAKAPPLMTAGGRLFPATVGARYDLLAGVRAATPDGLPLVGPGANPRVLLATGARRNGWLLAPMVARIVAASVAGRDPGAYASAFRPDRFA
jgi:glycine oxidase